MMMTFKKFMEAAPTGMLGGLGRESKLFSPPAYEVMTPELHKQKAQEWLVRIYQKLNHMVNSKSRELIVQPGGVYVLKSDVNLNWHPEAVRIFLSEGALVPLPNQIPVTTYRGQPDGTMRPTNIMADVYQINVNVVQQNLQVDYNKLTMRDRLKKFGIDMWKQSNIKRVPEFQGTKMFH